MTVHRLKLKDLTALFFQQLRQQYLDGEMEVEVRVRPKAPAEKPEPEMNDEEFWKIISLLDWSKTGDDEAVLKPAVAALSRFSEKEIARFHDLLSEKLHRLDGEKFARHIGENAYGSGNYFSADGFLYTRCCVVANGKTAFEQVLAHPEKMPKDLEFEPLLSLPEQAYFKKTGKSFEHIPAYNYETGFNSEGWGDKTIQLEKANVGEVPNPVDYPQNNRLFWASLHVCKSL
ncbi:MAG: DUF4240 domain-containing protein, partial [Bacteroidota bacterium]